MGRPDFAAEADAFALATEHARWQDRRDLHKTDMEKAWDAGYVAGRLAAQQYLDLLTALAEPPVALLTDLTDLTCEDDE